MTGNNIGDEGAKAISEMLKVNTTWIGLALSCEEKERNKKKKETIEKKNE